MGILAVATLAGCPAPRSDAPIAQASSASSAPDRPSTPADAAAPVPDEGAATADDPASAPGGDTFVAPEGGVHRGTRLSFDVTDGGTRISNLVAELLETCDREVPRTTIVGPNLSWDIIDGEFSGRLKEVAGGVSVYTTLEGRFTSATTVEGIIRQESVVAGSVCDTYKLTFTAVAT